MQPDAERRAPLDLLASVIVLAFLQLASLILTPDRVPVAIPVPGYNLVFGVGRSVLTLWVLFRLWQLIRRDGGPAHLALAANAANLVGLIYAEAWNALPSGLTSWTDDVLLVVRISGLVLLGRALIGWWRLADWVGWVLLSYVAVLSGSIVVGRLVSPGFARPIIGWAWLAALVALSVGLLSLRTGSGERISSRSAPVPSGI